MDVTLLPADGRALTARLYEPYRENGPAVVVAGATVTRGPSLILQLWCHANQH